jgi:hypothetical protein
MIWILLVLLIGYLLWINFLPQICQAAMTNSNKLLELDVKTFDKFYAGRRKQINLGRLERSKSNEYVLVFNVFLDASKKGKRFILYRDLPSSPKMYDAFQTLVLRPDDFFDTLSNISAPVVKVDKLADQSNKNNLSLHIENSPIKTTQYAPREHSSAWKNIERSRGNH